MPKRPNSARPTQPVKHRRAAVHPLRRCGDPKRRRHFGVGAGGLWVSSAGPSSGSPESLLRKPCRRQLDELRVQQGPTATTTTARTRGRGVCWIGLQRATVSDRFLHGVYDAHAIGMVIPQGTSRRGGPDEPNQSPVDHEDASHRPRARRRRSVRVKQGGTAGSCGRSTSTSTTRQRSRSRARGAQPAEDGDRGVRQARSVHDEGATRGAGLIDGEVLFGLPPPRALLDVLATERASLVDREAGASAQCEATTGTEFSDVGRPRLMPRRQ